MFLCDANTFLFHFFCTHPREYLEIQITPSQERIHEIVESAIVHGTTFINRLRSVLLVEDIVDSLKVQFFVCLLC